MITKFQALVARESMAAVFANDGQTVTVVKIREGHGTRKGIAWRSGVWTVLVEYSDGSRAYRLPEHVSPSQQVEELISNGTYREDTMTWHGGFDGPVPLKY